MSRRVKPLTLVLLSVVAVIITLVIAIGIGSVFISPRDIAASVRGALVGNPPESVPANMRQIILMIRIPRVLLAFITGAALSVSGAVVQSVLCNPLASPFTLGTSSGASLGASLVIVGGAMLSGTFLLPAVGSAAATVSMLFMIAFVRKIDRSFQSTAVVLSGMVLSLFLSAIVSLIANLSEEKYKQIMKWQTGSFAGKGYDYAAVLFAVLIICTTIVLLNCRELDILTFGDEQAQSIGVDTGRKKALLLIVSAVLSGTAVSFAGVIGFVDLISPHIARRLFGASHKTLIPMSAVTGGIFTVLCDLAARTVIKPNELPVGVVTSLLGAPFFAYVFISRRKKDGAA